MLRPEIGRPTVVNDIRRQVPVEWCSDAKIPRGGRVPVEWCLDVKKKHEKADRDHRR